MKAKIPVYMRRHSSIRLGDVKHMQVALRPKIIRVKVNGRLIPQYKSEGAAGCDLFAATNNRIKPGSFCAIPTGIRIEIPKGYEAQVRPRSGLAFNHGIGILNAPGTIDSDYRGEINVVLFNFGKKSFRIRTHDRIAQLVFNQIVRAEFDPTRNLTKTRRGSGGFGHTGR